MIQENDVTYHKFSDPVEGIQVEGFRVGLVLSVRIPEESIRLHEDGPIHVRQEWARKIRRVKRWCLKVSGRYANLDQMQFACQGEGMAWTDLSELGIVNALAE